MLQEKLTKSQQKYHVYSTAEYPATIVLDSAWENIFRERDL